MASFSKHAMSEIIYRVLESENGIAIPFASKKEAKAFQKRFYVHRKRYVKEPIVDKISAVIVEKETKVLVELKIFDLDLLGIMEL